ncbi:acyltransferase family protein [Blastococcus sp. VKM Ac-2987]|uniref:acyltransferase family protein n=1 Tax=Blastococcus sp. VKM Ac-2987 TaxID=3004141 RepID=UPI0022AB95AF|nr:acyltransferase [Blastococcus sp. VKM Ac-2987]MCZ2859535.1 acyltransferase [Blastococcus sp. VKM Ac-2987]
MHSVADPATPASGGRGSLGPSERPESRQTQLPDPSSEPTSPLKGEIRALTGLRFVASILVVALHLSYAPGPTFTGLLAPLAPVVAAGWLGVDLFFVLSGFVITLNYTGHLGQSFSARKAYVFLWARITRIWPTFALVTVLFGGWLLARSWFDDNPSFQAVQPQLSVPHLVEQLLMVQQWHRPYFPGASYVGPGWSVSAEWLAYCAFPVLALGLWRLRRASASVTGSLALLCMVPFVVHNLVAGTAGFEYQWLARIAAGFTAGALTCLAVQRLGTNPRSGPVAEKVAAVLAGCLLVAVFVADRVGAALGGDYQGVVVVLFPPLVGALALARGSGSRWLGSRVLVHGGRISYALYLVHYCVFEIVWTAMLSIAVIGPTTIGGSVVTVLSVPLALVLAHLLYTRVEEPARRKLRIIGPRTSEDRPGDARPRTRAATHAAKA